MPLESLNCTNCGSADVTEVNPSTYFCNNCDSVFKHLDPGKLTVAPSFCSCGNRVEFQCQVCRDTGLCRECDAAGAPIDSKIATVGFGYKVSGELYLSSKKLASTLKATHGELGHYCWTCMRAAVPETAERVVSGVACQTFDCGELAHSRCRCCRRSTCSRCKQGNVHGGTEFVIAVIAAEAHTWPAIGQERKFSIAFPSDANDVCAGCWLGHSLQLSLIIANEYAGILREPLERYPSEYSYDGRVPDVYYVTSRKRRRGQREEDERALSAAKRCAEELRERLNQLLSAVSGEEYSEVLSGSSIIDDRASTPAMAAPSEAKAK